MKILSTFMILAFSLSATSQTDQEIEDWQTNNPGKFLMHSDSYVNLDDGLKIKISARVVFYEDISSASSLEKVNDKGELKESGQSNAQTIKNWLVGHPDLKILTRSQFDSFDSITQSAYIDNLALILIGEKITIEDILNYPY